MATKAKPPQPTPMLDNAPLVIGNIRATRTAPLAIGNIRNVPVSIEAATPEQQADTLPGIPAVVTDRTPAERAAFEAIREPSAAEWAEVAANLHDAHEKIQ